ncbi:hypothetical protein A3770_08p50460 [Chloropicon primus]|uniref:PX domain-containing protein n=3 Tax=Chloropicon primus TaxID=1764295 RepID=A0A5B8MPC3_9CHLO|nr:hypothetical protein A3770_08p50460 [Chloropicon primus]|eukprot:QDZ22528.1 hypothetical protein A3770_08p50460 [Chloropicon primus]
MNTTTGEEKEDLEQAVEEGVMEDHDGSSLALSDVDSEPELLHALEPMDVVPGNGGLVAKFAARHTKTESQASLNAWLGAEDEAEEGESVQAQDVGKEGEGRESSSSLAASPSGEYDGWVLKLCGLIDSLKTTLGREECVGLQRHQGEYLLQQGQDLLAERRAQAAMQHVTSSTAPSTPSPTRSRSRSRSRREPLEVESVEAFMKRAKEAVNNLLASGVDQNADERGFGGIKVVYDSENVTKVTSLVESFLSRGLRSQPLHPLEQGMEVVDSSKNGDRSETRVSPRKKGGTWIKGLRWMVSKPQPFNVLYAAEGHGIDLGLKVITPRQNRNAKGLNKLHAWMRNSLVEGSLASRLDDLLQQHSFLKIWYDDGSFMRSEDTSSFFVGLLKPLSELQFNILLWPAQDFRSEPPKTQAYFSAGRLAREKKNEMDAFAKAVEQFQAQERLVTVIGEHSPQLHDIDEILNSPRQKGKGKKQSKKGKKRLVDAAEIGREKLERSTPSQSDQTFSFDHSFSFTELVPPPIKVGFEVPPVDTSNGAADPASPLQQEAVNSVSSLSRDIAGRMHFEEELDSARDKHAQEDSEKSIPPAMERSEAFLKKTEADTNKILESLESHVATSLENNANAFLLNNYEVTDPDRGDEEQKVIEEISLMVGLEERISALREDPDPEKETAEFLRRHKSESAEHAVPASDKFAHSDFGTNSLLDHCAEVEGDISLDLPDVPTTSLIPPKATTEGAKGTGGDDHHLPLDLPNVPTTSLIPPKATTEGAKGTGGDDHHLPLDLPDVPTTSLIPPKATTEAADHVEGGEDDRTLERDDLPHRFLQRIEGLENPTPPPILPGKCDGEQARSGLEKTISDLNTINDLKSILTDSEEPSPSHRKNESSVGILNVGIMGIETHGDKWSSYTVYQVYVQSGSGPSWLLRKRYSDFVQLHKELKVLFGSLPKPWEEIKLDKFLNFGHLRFNASVIEERRELLQECLRVAASSAPPLCTSEPLLRFLSPEEGEHGILEQIGFNGSNQEDLKMTYDEPRGTGQSVRLVVEEPFGKAVLEQLQVQHGRCCGCSVRIRGSTWTIPSSFIPLPFASNKGFALCEYTKQLYCTSCHTNQKMILPWAVLQDWDFRPRKVSGVAYEYLSSIFEQPILCVSAIRPQLFQRISLLDTVRLRRINLHKRFLQLQGTDFEKPLLNALGSRSYLLENVEFWSLRDLMDLSKGAFAELPGLLDNFEAKLQQATWDSLKSNLAMS